MKRSPGAVFRYSIRSIIASVLFVALAATSTYFGYAAYRLTIDYPDSNDPSPNVDGYWPAVVNLIYKNFRCNFGTVGNDGCCNMGATVRTPDGLK